VPGEEDDMKTSNLAQVSAPNLGSVVKADAVEVHYQADSSVVLHKAGCAHSESRTERAAYSIRPFDLSRPGYADDWYYIAPCAKKAS
jgi:hypothetical protein